MPAEQRLELPLAGIVLPESRSGESLDLGSLSGVHVLTLIRHRY